MASKVNKGKNVVGTYSLTPVSALSLLPHSSVDYFEKSFCHRIVSKQYVYNPACISVLISLCLLCYFIATFYDKYVMDIISFGYTWLVIYD